ncbi:hypothetical protein GF362_05800 [Candidatus Dojkabacteria bacterium]|nr:hypothetical protein [Candidatus Dojkabacteria bacterium]
MESKKLKKMKESIQRIKNRILKKSRLPSSKKRKFIGMFSMLFVLGFMAMIIGLSLYKKPQTTEEGEAAETVYCPTGTIAQGADGNDYCWHIGAAGETCSEVCGEAGGECSNGNWNDTNTCSLAKEIVRYVDCDQGCIEDSSATNNTAPAYEMSLGVGSTCYYRSNSVDVNCEAEQAVPGDFRLRLCACTIARPAEDNCSNGIDDDQDGDIDCDDSDCSDDSNCWVCSVPEDCGEDQTSTIGFRCTDEGRVREESTISYNCIDHQCLGMGAIGLLPAPCGSSPDSTNHECRDEGICYVPGTNNACPADPFSLLSDDESSVTLRWDPAPIESVTNYTLNIKAADSDHVFSTQVFHDSDPTTKIEYTHSNLQSGHTYEWWVDTFDSEGNAVCSMQGDDTFSTQAEKPNAPEFDPTSGSKFLNTLDVTISVEESDVDIIKYNINNGGWVEYTSEDKPLSVTFTIDETSIVSAKAVRAGIESDRVTVEYEKEKPPVPEISPNSGTTFKGSLTITLEASTALIDKLEYQINDGEWIEYTSDTKPLQTRFDIQESATIKARAYMGEDVSDTIVATYEKQSLEKPTNLQYSCSENGATVNFSWSPVAGAGSYLIRINKDGEFEPNDPTTGDLFVFTTSTSQTVPNIMANQIYNSWSVQPLFTTENDPDEYVHTLDRIVEGGSFKCNVADPNIPIINPYPIMTFLPGLQITGSKAPNTSILVNGVEQVPVDASTSWSTHIQLTDYGINTFQITSKNTAGIESIAVPVHIRRCIYGDINCDGTVNIVDFARFIQAIRSQVSLDQGRMTERYSFMMLADMNSDKRNDIRDFGLFKNEYLKHN